MQEYNKVKRKSLPSVGTIFMYWRELYDYVTNTFVDWGEPCCPVCGKAISSIMYTDIKKYSLLLENNDLQAIWDTAKLYKHHIIPLSLGGSDELYNLFIMCDECHNSVPAANERIYFFRWLKKHRNYYDKLVSGFIRSINDQCLKYLTENNYKLFLQFQKEATDDEMQIIVKAIKEMSLKYTPHFSKYNEKYKEDMFFRDLAKVSEGAIDIVIQLSIEKIVEYQKHKNSLNNSNPLCNTSLLEK